MKVNDYLGKVLKIEIDRPLGSKHPKHGFIYPVNYGYVPNTISGDGEELDCYLLGVFEPVENFEGKCIAIIHRTNDNDDKLIIVPDGKNYDNSAIEALTEFQEQYFEHVIIKNQFPIYIMLTIFIITVIICSCIFTMQINLEVHNNENSYLGGAEPY